MAPITRNKKGGDASCEDKPLKQTKKAQSFKRSNKTKKMQESSHGGDDGGDERLATSKCAAPTALAKKKSESLAETIERRISARTEDFLAFIRGFEDEGDGNDIGAALQEICSKLAPVMGNTQDPNAQDPMLDFIDQKTKQVDLVLETYRHIRDGPNLRTIRRKRMEPPAQQ